MENKFISQRSLSRSDTKAENLRLTHHRRAASSSGEARMTNFDCLSAAFQPDFEIFQTKNTKNSWNALKGEGGDVEGLITVTTARKCVFCFIEQSCAVSDETLLFWGSDARETFQTLTLLRLWKTGHDQPWQFPDKSENSNQLDASMQNFSAFSLSRLCRRS